MASGNLNPLPVPRPETLAANFQRNLQERNEQRATYWRNCITLTLQKNGRMPDDSPDFVKHTVHADDYEFVSGVLNPWLREHGYTRFEWARKNEPLLGYSNHWELTIYLTPPPFDGKC